MPSWARSLIVVAVGLVVWLAAAPAFAAAPLCDDRGAIMLAPAPTLDAPDASIDIGETNDCVDHHAFDASYEEGGRPDPSPAPTHVHVVLPSTLAMAPADLVFAPPGHDVAVVGTDVSKRLDRPPR